MLWLAVALGGSLGAMARYGVALAFAPSGIKFPVATLTVNVLGSLLIGVFYVIIVEKAMLPQVWRQIIMVGGMGAFTTFSTFSLEVLQLMQHGQWVTAITYAVVSFLLCLLAVFIGVMLTEHIFSY